MTWKPKANYHKLLEEWSIYVSQLQSDLKQYTKVEDNSVEHFDISRYMA